MRPSSARDPGRARAEDMELPLNRGFISYADLSPTEPRSISRHLPCEEGEAFVHYERIYILISTSMSLLQPCRRDPLLSLTRVLGRPPFHHTSTKKTSHQEPDSTLIRNQNGSSEFIMKSNVWLGLSFSAADHLPIPARRTDVPGSGATTLTRKLP